MMCGVTADRPPATRLLAVGIVTLEFAAAVSRFVVSALLLVIAADLHARDQLALLVAGSSLGLFAALPVAGRVLRILGGTGSLGVGVVAYAGGLVVALAGAAALMPDGTARLARGTPAALAAMTLFAVGYFGADSLITVLLTGGYHASLGQAAIVLGAASLAWGVTSLVAAHLAKDQVTTRLPAFGLAVSALGVLAVAAGAFAAPVFVLVLTGWSIAGLGVGLAYPPLYILSTTPGARTLGAAALATAVITAEDFGCLLGKAGGGAISSLGGGAGFGAAYVVFAALAAPCAATRAGPGIAVIGHRDRLGGGDNTR